MANAATDLLCLLASLLALTSNSMTKSAPNSGMFATALLILESHVQFQPGHGPPFGVQSFFPTVA